MDNKSDPTNDIVDFYDSVADDYHLWYRDWESTLEREGLQLRRWLRPHGVEQVLDASCGPGTQSIALAQLGYTVTGADPSPRMLKRARRHASEHGVADKIAFVQAAFADLPEQVSGQYDAVITKGNAFPHLVTDAEIAHALGVFYNLLRPGGMVIVGMQDFEPFIEDRPRFIPGRVHDPELEEPQIITFDIWDWDDGPPLTVTVNSFIVSGKGDDYRVIKRPVVYRALTATEVQVAMLEAGFQDIEIIRDRLELVMIAHKVEE
ncbi:MAG: class I SAM-dependent methyltransferase [Chloroflexi bacterium]|nr:class I SAM-dependent methyltransferase [Chloroflexota bacterium]